MLCVIETFGRVNNAMLELLEVKDNQGDGDGLGIPLRLCIKAPELMHSQIEFPARRARAFAQGPTFETFIASKKKFLDTTFFKQPQHKFTTMVKGSKLLAALDREKGVNPKLERNKRQQKAAEKRKRSRAEDQEDEVVLEDAIKEAEETVLGATGSKKEKKDKKGAKRAKVEQEDEADEDDEWESDDEDKTHAVCLACAADGGNIVHTLY